MQTMLPSSERFSELNMCKVLLIFRHTGTTETLRVSLAMHITIPYQVIQCMLVYCPAVDHQVMP